jgi:hypothetical protein
MPIDISLRGMAVPVGLKWSFAGLAVSDSLMLGLDSDCPFRLVAKIHNRQAVEFGCLRSISFQKPGFRHVIVVPAVRRIKGHRSFKNAESLVRLVLLNEKASLLRELQGSDAAGARLLPGLSCLLSLRSRFTGRARRRR